MFILLMKKQLIDKIMKNFNMSEICSTDCMRYRIGNCPFEDKKDCPRWQQYLSRYGYIVDAINALNNDYYEEISDEQYKVSVSYNDGIVVVDINKDGDDIKIRLKWNLSTSRVNDLESNEDKTDYIYITISDMVNMIKGAGI